MYSKLRDSAKLLFIMSGVLALTACQSPVTSYENKKRAKSFDEIIYEYTKFLRWGHFREITYFMTPEYKAASQEKVDSFKNIRVSSVKTGNWTSDETGNRLNGMVEIDYYVEHRAVIRQTKQQVAWIYDEEGKFWQLDSGLPELNPR
jgi:hypothetical protein